ncbi:hypothetical protein [Demetria terragena]|uniref:hypothetical protein n=1 Tax=Demetria terragena TaxID=63959 RepID=UPI00037EB7DE|nr:hypothetical protein [Demetria terragena]
MSDTDVPFEAALAANLQRGLAKSGVLWLGPTEHEAVPVWFAHLDPYVYVLTGPGEQNVPHLGDEAVMVLRDKDTRSRILVAPVEVGRLAPSHERWTGATEALAKGRLNAAALPSDLPERWATGAVVFELLPLVEDAHH